MATIRQTWIDTTKGIAIILVVLFHAVLFLNDVGLSGDWWEVSGLLDTYRMPLFFFASGLFAAGALRLSFAELFRRRIARLVWLYVLWSALWVVLFDVIPTARPGEPQWSDFAKIAWWPNESTWFVYALAVYFAIAWALRGLPLWLQFAPAIVLALLFGTNAVNFSNGSLDKMAMYFVFFMAAVHFSAQTRELATKVELKHALLCIAVYLPVAAVLVKTTVEKIPFVRLGAGVLAIAAGCTMAIVASPIRQLRWLTWLGRNTLQIYLLHFYPILFIAWLLRSSAPDIESLWPVLPPIVTVVAIGVSLGAWTILRHVPGLFELPKALTADPVRPRQVENAAS